MDTVLPSALIVGILYVLSRWSLASVDHAVAHPGIGQPEVTWKASWWISLIVSALSAASVHVWILTKTTPTGEVFLFNGLVFGGFLIGFAVSGHFDHKVRLGLRP